MNRGKKNSSQGQALVILSSAVALVLLVALGVGLLIRGKPVAQGEGAGSSPSLPVSEAQGEAAPGSALPREYRGVWVSYLEFEAMDCTTKDSFTAGAREIMANCAALGANTVVVQVRPFGDALYKSALFPWSHLLTGTQGEDPGYDPLAILVSLAHENGLRIEAWVNPYRVRLTEKKPAALAASNPAVAHPDWVAKAEGGLYYDPGLADVQALVADGVTEILENYAVDGIQFDDYFYPTTLEAFDQSTVPAGTADLAAWRRGNVDALVRRVYAAVKAARPDAVFGISPQGNFENNYALQYSDVEKWLANPGYVDYIMPQIYWGFGYEGSLTGTRYAFMNCAGEWAALPRADGVALYVGMGAYRVGAGDGSPAGDKEWYTGHNLADQVTALRGLAGVDGFCLYRYDSLFDGPAPYAGQEIDALQSVMTE